MYQELDETILFSLVALDLALLITPRMIDNVDYIRIGEQLFIKFSMFKSNHPGYNDKKEDQDETTQ